MADDVARRAWAGEMIAAFAEENHLATIVATTPAGRLLSGSVFRVGHGYILGLPRRSLPHLAWDSAGGKGRLTAP